MTEARILRIFWPLFRHHGWMIPLILVLGTVSSIAEGVGISFLAPLFQELGTSSPKQPGFAQPYNQFGGRALAALASEAPPRLIYAAVIIALLTQAALSYANTVLIAKTTSSFAHDLRCRTFHQLLWVNHRYLDENEWGRLLDILAAQTWRTSDALALIISAGINCCTIAVFSLILVLISWQLTLAILFGMLLLFVVFGSFNIVLKQLGNQAVQSNESLGKSMVDGMLGLRSIRAFSLEAFMQSGFDRTSDDVRSTFFRSDCWSGLVSPASEIGSFALLLAIFFLARQYGTGLPIVVVTLLIMYKLQAPFKQLETTRVKLAGLFGSARSVAGLLNSSANETIAVGNARFECLSDAIVFDRVTFCYTEGSPPAVRDLSFRIPRGKVTALVGLSGAGKTTIINLLCRFYDPGEGTILIDGRQLGELDLGSWRERIALAGQDVHLFNTSVRENIRYGRLDATDQEIEEAAIRAGAHDFVSSLPRKYETIAGNEGLRFSGGQRQRIALARAFLRQPEILILDEATNALDSLSEVWIQSALEGLAGKCTIVIAAHRLSTIQDADQIIVLDQGQVLEQGAPRSLLDRGGLFSRLYDLQVPFMKGRSYSQSL